MVRCKFKVTSIKQFHWGNAEVTLDTVYDSTIPEDLSFSKATPAGNITIQVDNPAALAQLQLGGYFYVDLTQVPEPQA